MDWIVELLSHESAGYLGLMLACTLYVVGLRYRVWRTPDLLSDFKKHEQTSGEWAKTAFDLVGRVDRVEEATRMHSGFEPRIIRTEGRVDSMTQRLDETFGRLERRHDTADLKLDEIARTLNQLVGSVGRLNGKK